MKKNITVLLFFLSISSVFASTNWLSSLDDAKSIAQGLNKPILVDFWAVWCGPCKKMDQDVWSKEEIKVLMENFVPVKIDLDANGALARSYNVQAIPNILILDGWGNTLYTSVGYKTKSDIKHLLENFSVNLTTVNQGLNILEKDTENVYSNIRVAQKFQDAAFVLKDESRKAFLRQSNAYFKDGMKLIPKDKAAFEEKVMLLMELNRAYGGAYKSVLKTLKKDFSKIDVSNQALYYYIQFYCYHFQDETDKAQLAYDEIVALKSNTYLKKANYLIKNTNL